MKTNAKFYRKIIAVIGITLLVAGMTTRTSRADDGRDFLYVGDGGDDTVKRFDAETGVYHGSFVTSGSGDLHGPRGLIFNHEGDLVVANQNVGLPINGAILTYNGKTGAFLGALVSSTDNNAPPAPRGIVLGGVLFVANVGDPGVNGELQAFTKRGKFIADLNPSTGFLPEFHPRGVVIGPDGLLYVSNSPSLAPSVPGAGLHGQILRFVSARVAASSFGLMTMAS